MLAFLCEECGLSRFWKVVGRSASRNCARCGATGPAGKHSLTCLAPCSCARGGGYWCRTCFSNACLCLQREPGFTIAATNLAFVVALALVAVSWSVLGQLTRKFEKDSWVCPWPCSMGTESTFVRVLLDDVSFVAELASSPRTMFGQRGLTSRRGGLHPTRMITESSVSMSMTPLHSLRLVMGSWVGGILKRTNVRTEC